jgi:hypothetical protein
MQTAGKPRPTQLKFDTLFYTDAGMCRVTQSGERNDKGVWHDKAAFGWIQFQHADGRKRLVTSYVVECGNPDQLPRSLELAGSNDGGTNWTTLDTQLAPGFNPSIRRREFAVYSPAKWNAYRLRFTVANPAEGIRIDAVQLNERIHCEPETSVTSLVLDQTALTLPVHQRATLNATLMPLDSFERQVIWNSSDPQIAEVRAIGEQTAMVVGKRPGTCSVTALIDGVKQVCPVTVQASTLPQGWFHDELNAPPIPGSVAVSDGQFILTGSGHAMTSWWERVRDQGAFVSRRVRGDVALSARLTQLTPNVGGPGYKWDTRPPTVSGLMIRESLGESAGRYVLVQVSSTGNLTCRWRDRTGDQDDNQVRELGKVTLPIHLKIEQAGGEIRIHTSTDGQDWGKPRMSHRATFDPSSRIGLFVCSGNTFASATAVHDSVQVRE